MEKLIPHSYIAKTQSTYLKAKKGISGCPRSYFCNGFREKFSFVLQDEAQGYHWTHGCCTLHTAVLYFQEDGTIKSESFLHSFG